MKILFLTTVQPTINTAVGNVEINILKYLLDKNNIIDQVIYLGNEDKQNIDDIGIKNTYFFKLTTMQRIFQIVKYPFEPCMLIFRKNKKYIQFIEELLDINSYDLVFVTYSQLAFVGTVLRRKGIPSALLIYDVLYQAFERKSKKTINPILKLFYLFEKIKCSHKEGSYYYQFNNLLCLTNKDKRLLNKLKCTTNISVMQTCYHDFGFDKKSNSRFVVCYFAAFDRMENVDAVNFYIKKIHPRLKQKYKDYSFIVMGKDADKVFFTGDKIEVLGFQEHPENILNSCSMSILPLRFGAGVKTKVLELLAMGIPCICSTVASEGIDETYGLETYYNLNECYDLVDKWYNTNIFNAKDRIRAEFLNKYPSKNTFDVLDNIINEVKGND